MGILDSISNVVGKVNKTTRTVGDVTRTAKDVQKISESTGKFFEKKCKLCKAPLKTEIEQQKQICVNCAMKQM